MSTKLNNVRLSLRRDTLENWNVISNHVLLSGEIAIVTKDNEENIKIGNGISSFASLPYLFQHQLKSDNIIADKVTAHSISQGYHVEPSNTSFATGIFTEAEGQFGTVHGIEAKISDDYAFVFNGVNFPNIDDRYFSHGEGTFNVNPKDGIGGFYIGDTSLSDILQEYSEDFKTYTNSVVVAAVQESHIYTDGKISSLNESISAVSSAVEIIGSDYLDSNDKIDILNRCIERDEIKFYYGPQEKQISLSVDTGSGEPLVQTVTLSAFSNCSNVSLISGGVEFGSDLSVVKLTNAEYNKLVVDRKVNISAIYIITDTFIDAKGQQLKNLSAPTDQNDAATKYYVDSSISSFTPPTYTAGYGLNLNDYQFNIDTSKIAEVSDLIIYEQISNKVSSISEYSTDIQYPTAKVVWDISDYIDGFEKAVYGEDKDRKFTEIPYIDINAISDTGLLYQQVNFVLEQINYEPLLDENSSYQDVINAVQAIYEDQGEVCPELTDIQAVVDAINAIATESPNMLAAPSGNGRMLFGGSAGTSKSMKQFVLGLKDKISQNKKQIASNLSNITDLITFAYNHVAMVNNNGQIYSNSLSVYKVTRQKYIDLVNNGEESESAVYVITDPGINAYNQRISCVADPVDDTDAVNKKYMNNELNDMNTRIGDVKNVVDSKHLNDYAETDVIAEDEDGNEFTFTIFTKGLNY